MLPRLRVLAGKRADKRLLQTLAASLACVAASAPRAAMACPACLGADAQNAAFLKVGSLFVLLPFAVVALVLYVLRQAPERETSPTREPATRS